MEQTSFEQAVMETLRQLPPGRWSAVLHILQTVVNEMKEPEHVDGRARYNIERHRAVRALTATIDGNLAATISPERDERG